MYELVKTKHSQKPELGTEVPLKKTHPTWPTVTSTALELAIVAPPNKQRIPSFL